MAESRDPMSPTTILREHSKYQVSFTGKPPLRSISPQPQRYVTQTKRKPASPSRSKPATTGPSRGSGFKTVTQQLDNRREARRDRVRPWQEKKKCHKAALEKLTIFYEKTLPANLDHSRINFKTRKYVSNTKFGNIYEIRQEVRNRKGATPTARHWIWEDEFQLWQKEKNIHINKNVRSSTTSLPSLAPSLASSQTSKSGSLKYIREFPNRERPNAELYARYHFQRMERSSRRIAAVVVQKLFRGWYVRHLLRTLKRKALLEHNQTWSAFIEDYREVITTVQSRYGVMDTACPVNLKQIRIFMDRKLELEKSFRIVSVNGRLHKKDFLEFFNRADLWPTMSDVNKAFDTIFRGSRNTAELVFMIDLSSRCENIDFYDVINFVRGIVIGLDVAPDRVRVGVIPFTDCVINSFSVNTYKSKLEVLKALSTLRANNGEVRTDLALKMLKHIFKSSRPGVQRVAVLVTDGKSMDPGNTRQEAIMCQLAEIKLFAVGIGRGIDDIELRTVATCQDMVYKALDIHDLRDIQQNITDRLCLAACGFCQHVLPRTVKQGLFLSETLELVWTTFPPLASGIDRCKMAPYFVIGENDLDHHGDPSAQPDVTVDLRDALHLVWTLRPPEACGLDQVPTSRWVRPIINGQEAWSLLDEGMMRATGMKACLRLVVQSKLERHGYVILPSDVKEGVERVTTENAAMNLIDKFLKDKQIECK